MNLSESTDQFFLVPVREWRVWASLGWMEIVQGYRRTFLGPIWLTLNIVIWSVAVSFVWAALFNTPTSDLAPYVTAGLMAWMWISSIIMEGGATFQTYGQYVRGIPIKKCHLIWAVAFKQVLVLAHHLVVYLGFIAIGLVPFNTNSLFLIVSMLVLFLLSVPIVAAISIIFVRYRDVQKMAGSLLILILVTTPVFWRPEFAGGRPSIFVYNPFYYIVEFFRLPILGEPIPIEITSVILGMTAAAWIIGFVVYRKFQQFVIYWV